MRAVQASACALVLVSWGCAKSVNDIRPQYVNPAIYGPYSCQQLLDERARLSREVAAVTDSQRNARSGDAALVGVGIIFWPALIGLAFTEDQASELSRLKGEYDAVEASMGTHGCVVAAEDRPPGL